MSNEEENASDFFDAESDDDSKPSIENVAMI